MSLKSLRASILAAALVAPVAVQSATVSIPTSGGSSLIANLIATGPAAWGKVDQAQSVVLPSGATWTTLPATLPSVDYPIAGGTNFDPCSNACSPYYGGAIGSPTPDGATGWAATPFFTVFDPHGPDYNAVQSAVLTFGSLQDSMSLLWGSPDNLNAIGLMLGGTQVASFWGADFNWFSETDPGIIGQPGAGVALLKLSGLNFDSVRFSTFANKGSFEFSNIMATPSQVPVPPAAFFLLAALGMLIAAAKRKTPNV